MAADGQSFAISLGLNFLFLAVIYFLFAVLRDAAPTKKFYAPRRYMRAAGAAAGAAGGAATGGFNSPGSSPLRPGGAAAAAGGGRPGGANSAYSSSSSSSTGKRPKRLPTGWFAWIGVVHRATQEDVIGVAGMDAAVYLAFLKLCELFFSLFFALFRFLASRSSEEEKKLTLGRVKKEKQLVKKKKKKKKRTVKELFIFVTFWSLATVLPTNLVGNEVANLKASGTLVPNEFTYWIPAGTPAIAPSTKSTLFGAGDAAFPDFYDKKVFLFCFCLVSVL